MMSKNLNQILIKKIDKLLVFFLVLISALACAAISEKHFSKEIGESFIPNVDLTPDVNFGVDEKALKGIKENLLDEDKVAESENHQIDLNKSSVKNEIDKVISTLPVDKDVNGDTISNSKAKIVLSNLNKATKVEKRNITMDSLDRIIAAHSNRKGSSYRPDSIEFEPQNPLLNDLNRVKNSKFVAQESNNIFESDYSLSLSDANLPGYINSEPSEILKGIEDYGWENNEINHANIQVTASEPSSVFLFLLSSLFLSWRFNFLPKFLRNRFS